jgi:tRNA(Ile)-lysidine synthetase-like protein
MVNKNLWVVGVSGGCDSMMLLDYLRLQGMGIIVAHVNYHQRATSDRDQLIVKQYCNDYQLQLEIYEPIYTSGNFQHWAREIRYRWFAELVSKYQCEGVMVAHHLNDSVETYFQQQEGRKGEYYGIIKENILFGCRVVRPLLQFTKAQIRDYCFQHSIVYGEDETNNLDKYQRNKIRKTIDQFSEIELHKYAELIDKKNQEQLDSNLILDRLVATINIEEFRKLPEIMLLSIMRRLFSRHRISQLTTAHLKELVVQLSYKHHYRLNTNQWIAITNQGIVVEEIFNFPYNVVMMSLNPIRHQYWTLECSGDKQNGLSVIESDFPIQIRSHQPHDKINLSFGTKKINRWFIDHKVAPWIRLVWPVVVNYNNEIIYVYGLGRSVERLNLPVNVYMTFKKGEQYVKK